MTGLGFVEMSVILCLCGLVVLGVFGFGVAIWLLAVERKSSHGQLEGLLDDDHPQYLTEERAAALFRGGDHLHALVDLNDVQAAAPQEGQILVRSGDIWHAADLPGQGSQARFRQLVTVRRVAPRLFEFWFTPDAPGNQAEIIDLPLAGLQVFRETESGPKYLTRITVEEVERIRRNVFRVSLRQESEFLRFAFDLVNLPLINERNLRSYALENGLLFLGQGGDHTVTVHYQLD